MLRRFRNNNITLITMCACVLHNLILIRYPHANLYVNSEDPDTHDLIPLTGHATSHRPSYPERCKRSARLPFTLLRLPCWCCPLARKVSNSSMNCIHSCSTILIYNKTKRPPTLYVPFVRVNGEEF